MRRPDVFGGFSLLLAVCLAAPGHTGTNDSTRVTVEVWGGDAEIVLRDARGRVDSVGAPGLPHCQREYTEPDENDEDKGVTTFTFTRAPV